MTHRQNVGQHVQRKVGHLNSLFPINVYCVCNIKLQFVFFLSEYQNKNMLCIALTAPLFSCTDEGLVMWMEACRIQLF